MKIPKGVITGRNVQKVYKLAKDKGFALPAVNVTGNNTINSVLETSSKLNSPVISIYETKQINECFILLFI